MRLRELAASRVRFGYRRLTVILRREGWRGQSQAHLSALHRGWAYGAHQITQEAGAAITDSYTQGDAARSEVEHGLHERETR